MHISLLKDLVHEELYELYSGPWGEYVVQAVFRSMEPKNRAYILGCLGGGTAPFGESSNGPMHALGIIHKNRLTNSFKQGLNRMLVLGASHSISSTPEEEEASKQASEKDLLKWTELVCGLVPPSEPSKKDLNPLILEVFEYLELFGQDGHPTPKGYAFLLDSAPDQIRTVAGCFLSKQTPENRLTFLRLLFRAYAMPSGSVIHEEEAVRIPNSLIKFMWICGWITSVSALLPREGEEEGAKDKKLRSLTLSGLLGHKPSIFQNIIVETTFSVSCSDPTRLQLIILGLFCELDSQLSGMVVGMISRESVIRAFRKGVTDEQVIGFLTKHAHPVVGRAVPTNVIDHIRLWKLELERVSAHRGRLYTLDAEHPSVFRSVVPGLESPRWSSESTKRVFVSGEQSQAFRDALSDARKRINM